MALFEVNAGAMADSSAPAELAGTVQPGYAQIEWLARQNSQRAASGELAASQRRETGFALEALGGATITIDAVPRLEVQAGSRRDANAPVAWQKTLQIDSNDPAEILGSTAIAALVNAVAVLEWLAVQKGDRRSALEISLDTAGKIDAPLENQSNATASLARDSGIPIEIVVSTPGYGGTQGEWVMSVAVTADSQLPAEIGGQTPAAAPAVFQVSGLRIRLIGG
jgi:hypothetical protein